MNSEFRIKAQAGQAGALEAGQQRGGAIAFGEGVVAGFAEPVAVDLDEFGGVGGNAVGAGEVNDAVEVEVLGGEDGVPEGVVGEEILPQRR